MIQCLSSWAEGVSQGIINFMDFFKGLQIQHGNYFKEFKNMLYLAGIAQLVEWHPLHGKVPGSIPSQGAYLGCRLGFRSGCMPQATNPCFSPSLLPHISSLSKINRNIKKQTNIPPQKNMGSIKSLKWAVVQWVLADSGLGHPSKTFVTLRSQWNCQNQFQKQTA